MIKQQNKSTRMWTIFAIVVLVGVYYPCRLNLAIQDSFCYERYYENVQVMNNCLSDADLSNNIGTAFINISLVICFIGSLIAIKKYL